MKENNIIKYSFFKRISNISSVFLFWEGGVVFLIGLLYENYKISPSIISTSIMVLIILISQYGVIKISQDTWYNPI